jgi:hypothetical protein
MPASDDNAGTTPGALKPQAATAPTVAHPGGSRSPERQYEFKPHENKIIGELAAKMHFVGLFLLAAGLLVIGIGVLVHHYGPILSGTIFCMVGLWTQRSSVSFKNVVYTEGHDISHLISALEDLRKLYSLQFWLLILALVFTVVSLGLVAFEVVDIQRLG